MLSKKHVTDTEMDLDLDAISHGDFRDVPQGFLTFVKSSYNKPETYHLVDFSEIKVTDEVFLKLSLNVLFQALFRKTQ